MFLKCRVLITVFSSLFLLWIFDFLIFLFFDFSIFYFSMFWFSLLSSHLWSQKVGKFKKEWSCEYFFKVFKLCYQFPNNFLVFLWVHIKKIDLKGERTFKHTHLYPIIRNTYVFLLTIAYSSEVLFISTRSFCFSFHFAWSNLFFPPLKNYRLEWS